MAEDIADLARERCKAQADRLIVERARIAVRVSLLLLPLFALADVWVNPHHLLPLWLQKFAHASVASLSLFLLHRNPRRAWAAPIVLLNMGVAIYLTLATSMIVGDDMTVPLFSVILVALSAGGMPWSLTEHFVALGICVSATVLNFVFVSGEFPARHAYRGVAIAAVWILSIYLSWDLARRRLAEARESLDRERAEAALRRRFDFEKLITGISARFINLAPDEIDRGIGAALRTIGEFNGIDRSYVFLLSPDRTSMSLTHWWVPDGGSVPVDDFRDLPLDHYAWLMERLHSGEVVHIGSIGGLPPAATAERRTFEARGVRSAAMVPMLSAGTLIGFLGFASTTEERSWDRDSETLLRMVAEILRNAIERRNTHAALMDSRRRLESEAEVAAALARVGHELISALNTPEMLNRLCQVTTEVLRCDFSHTWLWKAGEKALVPVAGFGDPPEVWEAIRVLRLPREALSEGTLTTQLAKDGIGQALISADDTGVLPHQLLPVSYGPSSLLCVSLRRGGEQIGALAAGFRGRPVAFGSEQERIMKGVAQLASLALENTRLVEQLDRANRLKAEFVRNMSHELRTPLNIILGYTELSLAGEYGDIGPELRDTLLRLKKSAHDLEELVNATLDVGRLETGKLPLDIKEISVGELVKEVARESRDLQAAARLAWSWHVDDDVPRIRTDPVKLKVVLKNLLSNAAKFTEKGGVTVEVQRRDRGVEFAVHDTGVGIAPELRTVIFEPFRQGDGSITRPYGGVGLGLYVARRLVGLMGGSMDFESEVGRGSVFRFWLPPDVKGRAKSPANP